MLRVLHINIDAAKEPLFSCLMMAVVSSLKKTLENPAPDL